MDKSEIEAKHEQLYFTCAEDSKFASAVLSAERLVICIDGGKPVVANCAHRNSYGVGIFFSKHWGVVTVCLSFSLMCSFKEIAAEIRQIFMFYSVQLI